MKASFSAVLLTFIVAGTVSAQDDERSRGPARPRVVVLTDFPPLDVRIDSGPAQKRSDPDDIQSMVRFLLYANDFEVEGLVASSATFANVADKRNLLDILDLYDGVVGNLKKHDDRYPTADHLRSVTWQGSSGSYGRPAKDVLGPGKDSEASEKIIALLDHPDSRPVWFCVWGGSCDLAQALWKIKETRSAYELERLVSKVRVYLIGLQDGTGQWLLDTFPKLFVIAARTTWTGMFGSEDLAWVVENIRNDHGVLGAVYPTVAMGVRPGVKEGDSPSFLHLVSAVRGLNDPERPDQSSWGGRFVRVDPARNHWTDHPSGAATVRRWKDAFDSDFAARMDWCVKEFKDANHTPVAEVKGGPERGARVGETVRLVAEAADPDGDRLSCKWWQEADADSVAATVTVAGGDSPDEASFVVPDEPGRWLHVVLAVTDDGAPALTCYRRVVVRIEP